MNELEDLQRELEELQKALKWCADRRAIVSFRTNGPDTMSVVEFTAGRGDSRVIYGADFLEAIRRCWRSEES